MDKSIQIFNWNACVAALTDAQLQNVAIERGYRPEFVRYLKEQGLIGSYQGQVAFPVREIESKTVGCHYRNKKNKWGYYPIGTSTKPFIIGDLSKAEIIYVFESQWDAFALMNALGWENTANKIAVIITRGANNGKLIQGLCQPNQTVYVFPQNDPRSNGKISPAEKWFQDICKYAGVKIIEVKTPFEFKDLNEWLQAGATAECFNLAIQAALENSKSTQSECSSKAKNELPKIYFDHQRNVYWKPNLSTGWMTQNETNIKRLLRKEGVSPKLMTDKHISPLDDILIKIQEENNIEYAGSLAGYFSGLHIICGKRVLVTDSPILIKPKEGEWPTLAKFLEGLLVDDTYDQRLYLYGWLKIALEALKNETRRAGQTLVIAGESNCGKSLLQNIITLLLGGRAAKPYPYMTGSTDFNSELFGAEHLMIEDEQASTDIRARRNIGARIKEFTVNEVQRCHAKGRIAVNLTPFWRLSVTVNDEPENLMVLPPLDDSLQDKLILLRAVKQEMPMSTATHTQRKEFWDKLVSELPAFIYFLENWLIPQELVCDRFGITHFHHPYLLNAIDGLAPEIRLLDLIDSEIFSGDKVTSWHGSAIDLEKSLTRSDSCDHEARKLFTYPTACGVYLGRLAKKKEGRVNSKVLHGQRIWTIHSPKSMEIVSTPSPF